MLPYYEEPTYHTLTPKELWEKYQQEKNNGQ